MLIDVFRGRFFLMRLLLLAATGVLITTGIITIYTIGHPTGSADVPSAHQSRDSDGAGGVDGTVPAAPDFTSGRDARAPSRYADYWQKQLAYAGAGVVCLVVVNLFNYQRLGPVSYLLYGIILVMLALLLVDRWVSLPFVHERFGIRRWFKIGFGFLIQPSEFCKVIYILALAWYLRFRSNYRTFKGLIGPFALTLLAMGLILLEPDLGTTLLMMPVLFAMLFVAGAKVRHLVLIAAMGVAVSPVMWHFMESYQRARISSVLLQNEAIFNAAGKHPTLGKILLGPDYRLKLRNWESDEGFQLVNAKRAIAAGGLVGYGFGRGPYTQQMPWLRLPEPHNDLIFAMIAHQFGIVGCGIVLLAYIMIITCALELAWLNTDPFGRLVAAGIAAMFAVQVLVNVGMAVGLMPITGLTLPLVSYGGSSMVVNLIAVGLLNNIGRHRPFSVAKKPFEFG
jgi:cell division protein FtsW (lipid II flippase)